MKIMVRGAPSAGKTTILRKICFDWASLQLHPGQSSDGISETLGQFKLVLPIILRLVEENVSLNDTLLYQMDFLTEKHFQTLHWLMEHDPNKILFILDGLDEYSDETNKEITDIMKGNKLNKVNYLITSRPHAVEQVKEWKRILMKEAELLGFDKIHVKEYIRLFFKMVENGEALGTSLIQELYPEDEKERINLRLSGLQELASNPGLLCMLCLLYKEKHKIISYTKEELYEEFIAYILSRWELKNLTKNQMRTPREEIIEKYKDVLLSFGRLADYGHNEKKTIYLKLYFSAEQVKECVGEKGLEYGFLAKSHPASQLDRCVFSFLHKTLQEYLVAYLWFHNANSDRFIKTMTKQHVTTSGFFEEMRYDFVLRILFHIFLSPTKVHNCVKQVIIELVEEDMKKSHLTSYCKKIMILLDGYNSRGYEFKSWGLEQHDHYMICKLPYYFMIGPNFIGQNTFNSRQEQSLSPKRQIKACYKNTVIVTQDSLTDMAMKTEVIDISPQEITELFVFSSDSDVEKADYSISSKNKFPRLNLICNKYSGLRIKNDTVFLEKIEIRDMRTLEAINSVYVLHTINMCKLGLPSFKISLVRHLEIADSYLEVKDIKALADEVTDKNHLEKLDLSQNSISKSGLHIVRLIMASPQLSELGLEYCGLIPSDLVEIYQFLDKEKYIHHTLLSLALNGNSLDGGGAAIVDLLKRLTLKSLQIPRCGLNNDDFKVVIQALLCQMPFVSHLRKLDVAYNKITDVDTLFYLLEHRPKELTSIHVSGNKFGDRLTELTRYTSKLEELSLCGTRQRNRKYKYWSLNHAAMDQCMIGFGLLPEFCALAVSNTGICKETAKTLKKQLDTLGIGSELMD